MLKFTSIVGYTSCGPTYIESFFTIFGQCINVLNYNEHYPNILVTFWGENEHFSGKNGALRWSILVGKQKHNVQKPIKFAFVIVYCHGRL